MSHYSDNPKMCRVDFFKADSLKWYTTEAIEFLQWDGTQDICKIFADSLRRQLKTNIGTPPYTAERVRLGGMIAVCLDPYHEHSHPIAIRVPEV